MPQDLLNFSTPASISIESIYENSVQLSLENIIGTTFLCLLGLNPRNTLSDNPFFAIILLNTSFLINPLLLLFTFFYPISFLFNYSRLISLLYYPIKGI